MFKKNAQENISKKQNKNYRFLLFIFNHASFGPPYRSGEGNVSEKWIVSMWREEKGICSCCFTSFHVSKENWNHFLKYWYCMNIIYWNTSYQRLISLTRMLALSASVNKSWNGPNLSTTVLGAWCSLRSQTATKLVLKSQKEHNCLAVY